MTDPQENAEIYLDTFSLLYNEIRLGAKPKPNLKQFLHNNSTTYKSLKDKRLSLDSFQKQARLGEGGYGSVDLVKEISTNKYYAIKSVKKRDVSFDKGTDGFMAEKEILAFGNKCQYITKLHHAFQDDKKLYFVMDFMAGGEFSDLLEDIDEGINSGKIPFNTVEGKMTFYAMEIINGLNAIHKYGFIHRDIKPGNVLVDETGHLKLADFGTCIKMAKNSNKCQFKTGPCTPDYVCPEVFRNQMQGKTSYYGPELDWWSFGCMLYEMMASYVPFESENDSELENLFSNFETELEKSFQLLKKTLLSLLKV